MSQAQLRQKSTRSFDVDEKRKKKSSSKLERKFHNVTI